MPVDTRSRVERILKEEVGIGQSIQLSSHLYDDLALDSLDTVVLTQGVEQEFGFEVTEVDAFKWRTVMDVVQFVNNKPCPCCGGSGKVAK